MPIFIENNYGPNIENFSGTIEINAEKKTVEMRSAPQTENTEEIVPVNMDDNTASESEETLEQAETIAPASEQPVEEEKLDLFLVTKDSPRDACEMVLDSIFRSSRSKKMVCEKLYKNEGSYFRLGAVGREERAKWLNQFPSNWQGRFLPDDMKYWRKTKK